MKLEERRRLSRVKIRKKMELGRQGKIRLQLLKSKMMRTSKWP